MNNIIIFDGDCPFCNKTIMFLAKLDNSDSFSFISNQSTIGKKLIKEFKLKNLFSETIITIIDNKCFFKSNAIFKFFKNINKFKVLQIIHKVIPIKLSDFIYSLISKNRKKIISNCEIPKSHIKSKFIIK
jgi:predicted DCC family thiol-disulfide oxidoreductase YuxK